MQLVYSSFDPGKECQFCPRLVMFRAENRAEYPSFCNAPVPSFGALDAQLLVVGLAPGLKGANQTGRPFTGDYAGIVLYGALQRHGFAHGIYQERADDGLALKNCRITNAVRCVPPENKPTTAEIKMCNSYLMQEIAAMPNLKVILSLGNISHSAVLAALKQKKSAYLFAHGAEHRIGGITLLNSYHCSRYNINTGRLNDNMFNDVVERAREIL